MSRQVAYRWKSAWRRAARAGLASKGKAGLQVQADGGTDRCGCEGAGGRTGEPRATRPTCGRFRVWQPSSGPDRGRGTIPAMSGVCWATTGSVANARSAARSSATSPRSRRVGKRVEWPAIKSRQRGPNPRLHRRKRTEHRPTRVRTWAPAATDAGDPGNLWLEEPLHDRRPGPVPVLLPDHPAVRAPRSSSSSGTSNDLFRETHRHLGRRPYPPQPPGSGLRGQH